MQIHQFAISDMPAAIELKVSCWPEELAGKTESTLSARLEITLSHYQ